MRTTHPDRETSDRPAIQTLPARGFAIAFVAAGLLFVLYPAIRPFSDETSLQDAAAFASHSWLVAHTMGMAAFVLMTLGLLGLHTHSQTTASTRRSLRAVVVSWIGTSLTLAFYGAETFGLAAIGPRALEHDDMSLITVADTIRLGPGIGFLTVGLLALTVGMGMSAAIIWRSGGQPRWSGIPLAAGLALYLPQFVAPQSLRIAHGALMLVGCLLLARELQSAHEHLVESSVSDPLGAPMSTKTQPSPSDLESPTRRRSAPLRLLRALFWNEDGQRARAPWLILIPVVGAFATMTIVELALADSGMALSVQHALWNAAAAFAAIALIVLSRRYLGARSLADYGLRFDRRWRTDLNAGLAIGIVGVTIPFVVGIALGWLEIAQVLSRGELALLPGIAVAVFAFTWVGLWEELTMRGVFLCSTADGLRRWLSPPRAIAAAIGLSGLVFGVGHLAHTGVSPLLLTWVFAGMVFGVIYVLSGSLALPIGIHITFNLAANAIFARTDRAGGEHYSTLTRVDVDPDLAFLQYGGLLDIAAFASVLLLSVGWLWRSQGDLTIDPARSQLEPDAGPSKWASTARAG
jgi:membrane protease YdiL (CAAX protease family)